MSSSPDDAMQLSPPSSDGVSVDGRSRFYYPPPPPPPPPPVLKSAGQNVDAMPKKFYFPLTTSAVDQPQQQQPLLPVTAATVTTEPEFEPDDGIYTAVDYDCTADEYGVYGDEPTFHHHPHQVYVLDDDDDVVGQQRNNYHQDDYFGCYETEDDDDVGGGGEFHYESNHGGGQPDVTGYGYHHQYHHHQQQQQPVQPVLHHPGQMVTIYGNPLVYSLHTIYEESENESSLQTLSSLTSSPMHSGQFNDNIHVQPKSLPIPIMVAAAAAAEEIKPEATASLASSSQDYRIQHVATMRGRDPPSVDEDSSQRDGLDYDDDDDDNDGSGGGGEDADTLTSKLERYFTSGLLETTTIVNVGPGSIQSWQSPSDSNQIEYHGDDDDDEIIEVEESATCATAIAIASSICNLIGRLKMISVYEDRQRSMMIIGQQVDHLSIRHRREMKWFIIRMIRISSHGHPKPTTNNRQEDEHEDGLARKVMDQLLLAPSSSPDDHRHREQEEEVVATLITLMIDIYSLTQVTHLLFNHRLWLEEMKKMAQQQRPRRSSLNTAATMPATGPVSAINHHRFPFKYANNNRPAATIKVTVNGQCLDAVSPVTGSVNGQKPANVATTIVAAGSVEYHRIVLQINDQQQQNHSDLDSPGENVNPKLSKFFRSSNPLNRSFLAKMAREPLPPSPVEDDEKLPVPEPIKPNRTKVQSNGTKTKQLPPPPPPAVETTNTGVKTKTTTTSSGFRQFSHATLDHLYEMLRKNPFSVANNKTKWTKGKPASETSLSRGSSSRNSSKSLSEPNLNGHDNDNDDDGAGDGGALRDDLAPAAASSVASLPGPEAEASLTKSPPPPPSKSTPLLAGKNGSSSWNTGSWDKRRHHRHQQQQRNGGSERKIGNHGNGGGGRSATINIKNRLQRTLSGSYTSMMAAAFQRTPATGTTTTTVDSAAATTSHRKDSSQRRSLHSNGNGDHQQPLEDVPKTNISAGIMSRIGKICLSIYYENQISSLTVTIFRCHLNFLKKTDLYVKVYFVADNQEEKALKRKTKVRKLSKTDAGDGTFVYEVQYNEILRFEGKWPFFVTGELAVSIWNHDTFGRNSMLGQTMIRLDQRVYQNSIKTRLWYDLKEMAKIKYESVMAKGSIFLAVKYEEPEPGTDGGQLFVLVKEAVDLNLPSHDINGFAYCKVFLKPERNKLDDRVKTKPVKQGQCPWWNETFKFSNISHQDLSNLGLEISVLWRQQDAVGSRIVPSSATGKTYLGGVYLTDHEDAAEEERHLWKQMIERPNLWAYGNISLHH